MTQLYDIQHRFWNSLRNPEANSACTQLFSKNGRITQKERLNIYRSTMRTAHIDALVETYQCCEKILGDKYFNQIASDYFYKYPATSQNLNLYGKSFPLFLQSWVQDHAELMDYKYLPDLAKLELARELAYYAKEDPIFDFNLLATLNEDSYQHIYFNLSSSLSVLRSIYPVYEIWHANQEQEGAKEIKAIHEPQYLCITRENFKPVIHKIDQLCWWVIEKIQNSSSFGELEILAQQEENDIPLQKIVPELINKKWICGYHTKKT